MACAPIVPPASGSDGRNAVRTSASRTPSLGRIENPEILEHQAALLGREILQLTPRRVANARPGGHAGRQQSRQVHAVPLGRSAGALHVRIGLRPRQRPPRVEQAAIQALLPLDRLTVEASGVELTGEVAGFLRERAGRAGPTGRLQALELLGEGALA